MATGPRHNPNKYYLTTQEARAFEQLPYISSDSDKQLAEPIYQASSTEQVTTEGPEPWTLHVIKKMYVMNT